MLSAFQWGKKADVCAVIDWESIHRVSILSDLKTGRYFSKCLLWVITRKFVHHQTFWQIWNIFILYFVLGSKFSRSAPFQIFKSRSAPLRFGVRAAASCSTSVKCWIGIAVFSCSNYLLTCQPSATCSLLISWMKWGCWNYCNKFSEITATVQHDHYVYFQSLQRI